MTIDIKPQKLPITQSLPAYLKDPANFPKVQKALYEIIASTCDHAEVIEWASCFKCQQKVRDHADFLRKLGFTSPAQYYAWKKIHTEITERQRLAKYND